MIPDDGYKIIEFLHEAEKLKTILRHSWLSNGRRESVAEHSWRMALMAILMSPYLEKPADLLQTIKLTIVHDLVEINYKDNPAFKHQPIDKTTQERKSIRKLVKPLPIKLQKEILNLWEEYEDGKTAEAKFANALDKVEVLLQHNEADYRYMTKKEYLFNFYHGMAQAEHDKFLKDFRQILNEDFLKGYQKHKVDKKLYQGYLDSI
jgi:putative hydrolase of HD superfamily